MLWLLQFEDDMPFTVDLQLKKRAASATTLDEKIAKMRSLKKREVCIYIYVIYIKLYV